MSGVTYGYHGQLRARRRRSASAVQRTLRWFGLILEGLGDLGRSIVTNPTTAPPVSGPVGIATSLGDVFRNIGPI